jgi:hypothetical protein
MRAPGVSLDMPDGELVKKAKGGEISDEERYGKVGAEIRRLDPEAYKNRTDKSAAANMKLLRELREKSKESSSRSMSTDEFMQGTKKRGFDVSSSGSDAPSRKMSTDEFMQGTKKRGFNVSAAKPEKSDTPARTMSAKEFMEGTKKRGFNVSAPRAADSDTPARRVSADDFLKGMKKGGVARSSASKRADGCAVRGKTKGRMV